MTKPMFEPGTFALGVNYWPSDTATEMWKKFDPVSIEKDFELFEKHHMNLLRVFPLWEDFQPIKFLNTPFGEHGHRIIETRFADERPLPDTEAGRAGVDESMMQKFETFCDLAEKHHLELIVCIMTSQMTFRLFTSQAMEGKDLYLDPRALKWEAKYLRYFVKRMKHHKAIRAWESGNESNCLGPVEYPETAAFWMDFVNTVIREADPNRPVIGVNGSEIVEKDRKWLLRDIAEVSDAVSEHPYPMFGKANKDPFQSLRGTFYGISLSHITEDVSGIESFIEETGVRRSTTIDQERLGEALRCHLWNAWACGCHSYLWWCAFDQNTMTCAPYDWPQPTLELGCFKADRTPMPAALMFSKFAEFLQSLPFPNLPAAKRDAVCVLDDKEIGCITDILAQQNGANLHFQGPFPNMAESPVYLLPSIAGRGFMSTGTWENLKERVRNGATLYISLDNCFLTDLDQVCGAVVTECSEPGGCMTYHIGEAELTLPCPVLRKMESCGAEVLGRDAAGNPVFFRNRYGKGTVYTLAFALEKVISDHSGLLDGNAWKVYQFLFGNKQRLFTAAVPHVIVSDHYFDDAHAVALVRNCSGNPTETAVKVLDSWKAGKTFTDTPGAVLNGNRIILPPNGCMAIQMEEK